MQSVVHGRVTGVNVHRRGPTSRVDNKLLGDKHIETVVRFKAVLLQVHSGPEIIQVIGDKLFHVPATNPLPVPIPFATQHNKDIPTPNLAGANSMRQLKVINE